MSFMEQVFILYWYTQCCTIKARLALVSYLLASSFCMLDSATFELHIYKNVHQASELCEIRHNLKQNCNNKPFKITEHSEYTISRQYKIKKNNKRKNRGQSKQLTLTTKNSFSPSFCPSCFPDERQLAWEKSSAFFNPGSDWGLYLQVPEKQGNELALCCISVTTFEQLTLPAKGFRFLSILFDLCSLFAHLWNATLKCMTTTFTVYSLISELPGVFLWWLFSQSFSIFLFFRVQSKLYGPNSKPKYYNKNSEWSEI